MDKGIADYYLLDIARDMWGYIDEWDLSPTEDDWLNLKDILVNALGYDFLTPDYEEIIRNCYFKLISIRGRHM